MKFTVTKPVEVDIAFVHISIPVRDYEDGMPADFPRRQGDKWDVVVNIDTGKIVSWPERGGFIVDEKVVDQGFYELIDGEGLLVASLENDYVPHGVIPGKYGDYVYLNIVDGVITNWPRWVDVSAFFKGE